MENKTKKSGGARKGAGRPKAPEKTTVLTFRVPESKAPGLKAKIAALIARGTKKATY